MIDLPLNFPVECCVKNPGLSMVVVQEVMESIGLGIVVSWDHTCYMFDQQ